MTLKGKSIEDVVIESGDGEDERESHDGMTDRLFQFYKDAVRDVKGEFDIAVIASAMESKLNKGGVDARRLVHQALLLLCRQFSKRQSGKQSMTEMERKMLSPELPLELVLGGNKRIKRADAVRDHVNKNWSIREQNFAGVKRAHTFYREAKELALNALKGKGPQVTLKQVGLYSDDD
jgi:hypothetical protein